MASVAALWRLLRFRFAPERAYLYVQADVGTMGFGFLQLLLVPFPTDHPLLLGAVVGHALAVAAVTTPSLIALYTRAEPGGSATNLSP